MTTHLEDKPNSGAFKITRWWYHYATLCGMSFPGGQAEHRIAKPNAEPTFEGCEAARRAKVMP